MRALRNVSAAAMFRLPTALGWASLLVLGIGAAGCTAAGRAAVPASGQAPSLAQSIAPGLSVSCAPGQRTLVRQLVSNGQPVTDVQCVSDQLMNAPVAPVAPVAYAASYPPSAAEAWTPQPMRPNARTVAYRTDGDTLTYEPRAPRRVVRSGRSWKKSAVIVGSSAGLGAGIGAAIGGKKGALIGAALGGGSAAIWDQATRR